MANSIPYRLGVFVRRYPFVPLLAVAALLAYLTLDGRSTSATPGTTPSTTASAVAAPRGPAPPPPCTTGLAEQMASAKQLLAAKQPLQAYDALFDCRDAHAAGPDAATYAKALAQWQQATDAKARQEQKAEAARKKREGVRLGMSPEDVLASSWGMPDKINRTTRASGTSEQWVYRERGEGYLYFDNDVLTSIQN
jgi:hypothetical protein